MNKNQSYIAFLRGINVGGHKKVPMAELRQLMEKAGFQKVQTLLNSGNVIFQTTPKANGAIEAKLAVLLQDQFGFEVPVIVRKGETLDALIQAAPFEKIELSKDIRLYVTFLKEKTDNKLKLPWVSDDKSFRILNIYDNAVCSVLDISQNKSTKAMEMLEQHFGKNITTRNRNTLLKIKTKLA